MKPRGPFDPIGLIVWVSIICGCVGIVSCTAFNIKKQWTSEVTQKVSFKERCKNEPKVSIDRIGGNFSVCDIDACNIVCKKKGEI